MRPFSQALRSGTRLIPEAVIAPGFEVSQASVEFKLNNYQVGYDFASGCDYD